MKKRYSGESNILQKNKTTIDKQAINIDFNIYELEFTGGKHDITISKDNNLTTFINFFSVKPENQQELVDLWWQIFTRVLTEQELSTMLNGRRKKIRRE
ncbi:MAG TPA: hypothetical protein VF884_09675 [Nitrososphaeraceae archaeon]